MVREVGLVELVDPPLVGVEFAPVAEPVAVPEFVGGVALELELVPVPVLLPARRLVLCERRGELVG